MAKDKLIDELEDFEILLSDKRHNEIAILLRQLSIAIKETNNNDNTRRLIKISSDGFDSLVKKINDLPESSTEIDYSGMIKGIQLSLKEVTNNQERIIEALLDKKKPCTLEVIRGRNNMIERIEVKYD